MVGRLTFPVWFRPLSTSSFRVFRSGLCGQYFGCCWARKTSAVVGLLLGKSSVFPSVPNSSLRGSNKCKVSTQQVICCAETKTSNHITSYHITSYHITPCCYHGKNHPELGTESRLGSRWGWMLSRVETRVGCCRGRGGRGGKRASNTVSFCGSSKCVERAVTCRRDF